MAFTQPFLSSTDKKSTKYHSIFLDDTKSMAWLDKNNISNFQNAQSKVLELIERASTDDQFNIQTTAHHPYRWRWLDKKNAKEYVQSIQNTGHFESMSTIYHRLDEMARSQNAERYIFSDFQKSSLDSNIENSDRILNLIGVGTDKQKSNLYFKGINLLGNAQVAEKNSLKYELQRTDNQSNRSGTLKLFINDELKGSTSYDFGNDSISTSGTIDFQSAEMGWNRIMLVASSDGLVEDDTIRISAPLVQNYKVLLCYQQGLNPFLQAVFAPEQKIITHTTSLSALGNEASKSYNMLVLNNIKSFGQENLNQIRQLMQRGASVIFFPSSGMDIASINSYLGPISGVDYRNEVNQKLQVAKLNTDHPLWKNIFNSVPQNLSLPEVSKYFPMSVTGSGFIQNLMEFSNGSAYLVSRQTSHGYFVSSASDINVSSSDLAESYYFLPLLYSLSKSSNSADSYTFTDEEGLSLPIDMPKSDQDVLLFTQGQKEVVARLQFLDYGAQVQLPEGMLSTGFWNLETHENQRLDKQIAVNFGVKESDLRSADESELMQYFGKQSKYWKDSDSMTKILDQEKSFSLWKLLIIFALITLILESLMIHNKKA